MDRVAEVVVRSNKALGIYAAVPGAARTWLDKGARYITTGTDGFIKSGMQDYLAQVRDRRS
jgi:2-keto-3-deoxy-L-rhamnonate aldolase RhmA